MPEITSARGQQMMIGEVSRRTGCNIETIRYYERIGVLPQPPRSKGGHRVYGESHLKRLAFVRRARGLGFTQQEVRGLLELVDGGDFTCGEIKEIALAHADEVRQKISDLQRMENVLSNMAAECDGGTVPDCPIIDALFQEPG